MERNVAESIFLFLFGILFAFFPKYARVFTSYEVFQKVPEPSLVTKIWRRGWGIIFLLLSCYGFYNNYVAHS